jgi:hypothetical protein
VALSFCSALLPTRSTSGETSEEVLRRNADARAVKGSVERDAAGEVMGKGRWCAVYGPSLNYNGAPAILPVPAFAPGSCTGQPVESPGLWPTVRGVKWAVRRAEIGRDRIAMICVQ